MKRCFAVAESMRVIGQPVFLCRWITAAMEREARVAGFPVVQLGRDDASSSCVPADAVVWLSENWRDDADQSMRALASWGKAKLLVVDHYGLDVCWEACMRSVADTILVIDDLANRQHDANILLDQTFNRSTSDYVGLVSKECHLLCGSQYALLRDGFYRLRSGAELRRRNVKMASRLLVSFGGTDPSDLSSVVLDAIAMLPSRRGLHIDVVLTSSAPHIETLAAKAAAQDYSVKLHVDVADMASIMVSADLAIGASGASTWERAALGLPAIILVTADNQRHVAAMVRETGAVLLLDAGGKDTASMIGEAVSSVCNDPVALQRMSAAAFRLCDGLGLDRVREVILARECYAAAGSNGPEIRLRPATEADETTVYMWQGSPGIRRHSRNPEVPAQEEHREWFHRVLRDNSRRLYIIECADMPAGLIRLDGMNGNSAFEVSILVSETFQRLGIGFWALKEAKGMEEVRELHAYVKPENLTSIRLFVESGFVLEGNDWYIWRKGKPGSVFRKEAIIN